MNIVMLMGKITNMPTTAKQTSGGNSMIAFTIKTKKKSPDGTRVWSQFHRCVAWNTIADKLANEQLGSDDLLFVEGSLGTRMWTDKDGKKQYVTEVTVYKYEHEELLSAGDGARQSDSPEDDWLD